MIDKRMLKGVYQSARPANVPTLITNAAVAIACVLGAERLDVGVMDWGNFAYVVVMGLCFYLYGMWGNDQMDARWDAKHYPQRPVPSGAVGAGTLRMLSLLAAMSGLVLSTVLGGDIVVGILLVIVIAVYNMVHKVYRWSVLLMGASRGLWVILAGSVVGGAIIGGTDISQMLLYYGLSLFVWTMVISIVARKESQNATSQKTVKMLLSGMCLFDALWLWGLGVDWWWMAVVLWGGICGLQRWGCRST